MIGLNKIKEIRQKKSFKDFSYLFLSNLALRPIQFVKGIIIAKYIDPSAYGLYRSGELILMLNKFGNLGFNSTAQREIGQARGENNIEKEKFYRSACFSGEFSLALVLLILGLAGSLTTMNNKLTMLVIIMSTLALFASKIHGIYNTEATIQKNFKVISTSNLLSTLSSSILTICLVPFWGIYSVLIFPIFQEIVALFLITRKIKIRSNFILFNKNILKTLKTSMQFSLGTLSYGAFKYTERIIILNQIGQIGLGFFSFSTLISEQLTQFVLMMVKVRKQKMFEELGKQNYQYVHKSVKRETYTFLGISLFLIPIIAIAYKYLIPMYLPKWVEAIDYSYWMLLLLPLKVLGSYEAIIITSAIVNKQNMLTKGMVISTMCMISLSILLIYLGKFNLMTFVYINLFSNLIYIVVINFTYYKYFYKKFINVR